MSNVVAVQSKQMDWSQDDIKLITDTVAKGATPSELKLFLARCKLLGLDPLKPGHIHFVKYGTGPGTIVVGLDGFRSISERTGKKSGVKRGVIRDEKGVCTGAWAEVYRSDWKEPAREEVPLAEYNTWKGPWLKMPETMIKKVAEVAALRMAFPDVLGGIYAPEEMEQAERGRVAPQQPEPGDGDTTPDPEKMQCGQYPGRRMSEVPLADLEAYAAKLEKKIADGTLRFKDANDARALYKQISDYIADVQSLPFDLDDKE